MLTAAARPHSSAITTRPFTNGNSQAVRIPKELRISAAQVQIFRAENGDVVIRPLPDVPLDRGAAMLAAIKGFPAEAVAALEQQRAEQQPVQEREAF